MYISLSINTYIYIYIYIYIHTQKRQEPTQHGAVLWGISSSFPRRNIRDNLFQGVGGAGTAIL